MRLDPNIIRQQIANLLTTCPELAEDDVLRADMVEAETDAHTFLSIITRKIGETKALSDGANGYAAELLERCGRLDRRVESLRKFIFQIMEAAALKSAELPEATLSIRAGQQKVLITDETQIPDALFKIKREPDKTAIKEKLKSGEIVAGAQLSNAEPSLSIRTK